MPEPKDMDTGALCEAAVLMVAELTARVTEVAEKDDYILGKAVARGNKAEAANERLRAEQHTDRASMKELYRLEHWTDTLEAEVRRLRAHIESCIKQPCAFCGTSGVLEPDV